MRLLVRVPEAYALLGPFDAKRPGFLVLDGEGRRVDMIDLDKLTGRAEIAARLEKAATAPALERVRIGFEGGAGQLPSKVKALKGIRDAGVYGPELVITAEPGAAAPKLIREVAGAVRFVDPVEVELAAGEAAPGAWYAEGSRAYVPRTLVDPAWRIASLETRTIDVKGIGKGPRAARAPAAALGVPGVVTVVPDFEAEKLAVVARAGAVDWAAVEKAVAAAR